MSNMLLNNLGERYVSKRGGRSYQICVRSESREQGPNDKPPSVNEYLNFLLLYGSLWYFHSFECCAILLVFYFNRYKRIIRKCNE